MSNVLKVYIATPRCLVLFSAVPALKYLEYIAPVIFLVILKGEIK